MFKFRLQRILELREKHEQAQARELASAQNSADVARENRDTIASLRDTSKAQISASTQGGSLVGHLNQFGYVLDSLDARVERAGEQVQQAEVKVQDAQTLLEDAARDRRVLDRLKERHAEVFRNDEAHKDRVHMDEIALSQFSRKQDPAISRDDKKTTQSQQSHSSPQADADHSDTSINGVTQ